MAKKFSMLLRIFMIASLTIFISWSNVVSSSSHTFVSSYEMDSSHAFGINNLDARQDLMLAGMRSCN